MRWAMRGRSVNKYLRTICCRRGKICKELRVIILPAPNGQHLFSRQFIGRDLENTESNNNQIGATQHNTRPVQEDNNIES